MRLEQRERLEILARRLDLEVSNPEPVGFNLYDWASTNSEINENGEWIPKCGTNACACGLATTIPELNQAGFKLWKYKLMSGGSKFGVSYRHPSGLSFTGWAAVTAFFGLNRSDAAHIFSPSEYRSEEWTNTKLVAERIREVLARE